MLLFNPLMQHFFPYYPFRLILVSKHSKNSWNTENPNKLATICHCKESKENENHRSNCYKTVPFFEAHNCSCYIQFHMHILVCNWITAEHTLVILVWNDCLNLHRYYQVKSVSIRRLVHILDTILWCPEIVWRMSTVHALETRGLKRFDFTASQILFNLIAFFRFIAVWVVKVINFKLNNQKHVVTLNIIRQIRFQFTYVTCNMITMRQNNWMIFGFLICALHQS